VLAAIAPPAPTAPLPPAPIAPLPPAPIMPPLVLAVSAVAVAPPAPPAAVIVALPGPSTTDTSESTLLEHSPSTQTNPSLQSASRKHSPPLPSPFWGPPQPMLTANTSSAGQHRSTKPRLKR